MLFHSPLGIFTLDTVGIRLQEDLDILPAKLELPSFNSWAFIDGAAFSTTCFSNFFISFSVRTFLFERLETILR